MTSSNYILSGELKYTPSKVLDRKINNRHLL